MKLTPDSAKALSQALFRNDTGAAADTVRGAATVKRRIVGKGKV